MLARDLMTKEVVTVYRDTTVKEAASLLLKHRISGLPVIDKENRVVGLVSERDLIYQGKTILVESAYLEILGGSSYLQNPDRLAQDIMRMAESKVGDVMTTKVYTVKEDARLVDIATIMVEKKVNRTPVVDDTGRLIGIISRNDLMKALHNTPQKLDSGI